MLSTLIRQSRSLSGSAVRQGARRPDPRQINRSRLMTPDMYFALNSVIPAFKSGTDAFRDPRSQAAKHLCQRIENWKFKTEGDEVSPEDLALLERASTAMFHLMGSQHKDEAIMIYKSLRRTPLPLHALPNTRVIEVYRFASLYKEVITFYEELQSENIRPGPDMIQHYISACLSVGDLKRVLAAIELHEGGDFQLSPPLLVRIVMNAGESLDASVLDETMGFIRRQKLEDTPSIVFALICARAFLGQLDQAAALAEPLKPSASKVPELSRPDMLSKIMRRLGDLSRDVDRFAEILRSLGADLSDSAVAKAKRQRKNTEDAAALADMQPIHQAIREGRISDALEKIESSRAIGRRVHGNLVMELIHHRTLPGAVNALAPAIEAVMETGGSLRVDTLNIALRTTKMMGRLEDAMVIFKTGVKHGLVDTRSYNAFIQALVGGGLTNAAISILNEMTSSGVALNAYTVLPVINQLCRQRRTADAVEYYRLLKSQFRAQKYRNAVHELNKPLERLIQGFGQEQMMDEAYAFIDEHPNKLNAFVYLLRGALQDFVKTPQDAAARLAGMADILERAQAANAVPQLRWSMRDKSDPLDVTMHSIGRDITRLTEQALIGNDPETINSVLATYGRINAVCGNFSVTFGDSMISALTRGLQAYGGDPSATLAHVMRVFLEDKCFVVSKAETPSDAEELTKKNYQRLLYRLARICRRKHVDTVLAVEKMYSDAGFPPSSEYLEFMMTTAQDLKMPAEVERLLAALRRTPRGVPKETFISAIKFYQEMGNTAVAKQLTAEMQEVSGKDWSEEAKIEINQTMILSAKTADKVTQLLAGLPESARDATMYSTAVERLADLKAVDRALALAREQDPSLSLLPPGRQKDSQKGGDAGGSVLSYQALHSLMFACASSGRLDEATAILAHIESQHMLPSVSDYDKLINHALSANTPSAAISLYERLREQGRKPSFDTIAKMNAKCARHPKWKEIVKSFAS